jgi:hypothetical protein
LELGVSTGYRKGALGGPLHQSAPVKAHTTLRIAAALMYSFFRPTCHYVRDITLFN